ncbi:unnamed protein product [Closterium sp. NIES-64]|nr:unnamed protein product [Closterium sp. NIES-64]
MATLSVTSAGLRLPVKPNSIATPPHALASSLTLIPVTRRLIAAPPRAPRVGVNLLRLSAFQPGAARAAVGETTDRRNAGAKRGGDGAANRVHDVIMADVSEEAKSRLKKLSTFPSIAEKQQGRDSGSLPRRIRGKASNSAESARVEGDWPISWCHVADNVLIGSPLATAADAKAVLAAADVTAVVALMATFLPSSLTPLSHLPHVIELGVDWPAVAAAVTEAPGGGDRAYGRAVICGVSLFSLTFRFLPQPPLPSFPAPQLQTEQQERELGVDWPAVAAAVTEAGGAAVRVESVETLGESAAVAAAAAAAAGEKGDSSANAQLGRREILLLIAGCAKDWVGAAVKGWAGGAAVRVESEETLGESAAVAAAAAAAAAGEKVDSSANNQYQAASLSFQPPRSFPRSLSASTPSQFRTPPQVPVLLEAVRVVASLAASSLTARPPLYTFPPSPLLPPPQVPVLLEAVRVVASLAASGHRVLVVSCQPNAASALTALGYLPLVKGETAEAAAAALKRVYLSLVKGETAEAAAAALKRVCPSARPALEALEQTHTHLGAGNSQRLIPDAQSPPFIPHSAHPCTGISPWYLSLVKGETAEAAAAALKRVCPSARPALEALEQTHTHLGAGNSQRLIPDAQSPPFIPHSAHPCTAQVSLPGEGRDGGGSSSGAEAGVPLGQTGSSRPGADPHAPGGGYLSLVKGETAEAAAAALKRVCPSARPALEALEQTHTHLAAGNSQRLTKLAAAELQQRIAKGVRGSSASDWKAAERKLAMEGFQRMVAADVALSEALSKAAIRRATREAEKQIEGGAVSGGEKGCKRRGRGERREWVRGKGGGRERGEWGRGTRVGGVGWGIPQEKVNILMAQIQQLEARQKAAAEAETAATDRISFFLNQLTTLRTKHAEAEKTAKAASARASRLATQLSAAANREAWSQASAEAAQGRIGELEAEVAGLRERESELIEARRKAEAEAEEAKKKAEALKAEVVNVGAKQEEAVAAMAEAKERIGFLSGVVKELEQKEKAARSEVASAVQMTQVVEKREQAALVKVKDLTTRVAALETEVAAAHEAARIANGKCEFFARVMETLREREQAALAQARQANTLLAGVKAELAAAKEREASLRASWKEAVARAEKVVAELGAAKRMQGEAVREREAAELALAAADSPMMAKAALQAAINNEAYLTALVSTLTARLSDATAERATAGERMRFLERQLAEGKEREREARERVRAAEREKEGLVVQVERVKKSEEEARREVGVLMQKLDSVAAQSKAAEQVEGAIVIMRAQVDVLQAELAAAKQTAEAASERSSFLLRQMELIKSRQQQKLDAAVAEAVSAEQKKSGAASPVASNAEAIMEAAVEKLQKQLAEARAEAEAASENVSKLEGRVGQLQAKEKEAKVLLGRADEKISDLFVQLSAAREKEKVEAKALMKARVELGELSGKVTKLEVELKEKEAMVGGVGMGVGAAATKMVVDLSKGAKELHSRLQDSVARLGQSVTAKSAASAVPDKEEEEIIAAAANLREAVEALNTPATNGSATNPSSLRSFDDAVQFDSKSPEAVPVPAKYRNSN